MTKEQAYERLEIPIGSDLQTIRRKFAEMHNDYRMRIENAPTPRLKQTFENGLEELKEAYTLLNESDGMDDSAELPRTERSFEQPAPLTTGQGTEKESMQRQQQKKQRPKEKSKVSPAKPKSNANLFVGIVAVVIIVLAGFYFLSNRAANPSNSAITADLRQDSIAWEAVLVANNEAAYKHYLKQYPEGMFTQAALDSLAQMNTDTTTKRIDVKQKDNEAARQLTQPQERSKQLAQQEQNESSQPIAVAIQSKLQASENIDWRIKYDKIYEFYEGIARAGLNDKWGFVDKNGHEITPIKFQSVGDFRSGLARVKLNDKWGFVDKVGETIVPPKYEFADGFREGFARVKLNNLWGYIDRTGREIISPKYEFAENFSEGLAAFSPTQKEQWGFIDITDRKIIPLHYDFARSFSEGLASVSLNGKWGFIDKSGRTVISLKYSSALPFYKGRAKVKLDGEEFYINNQDKCVADCPD